MKHKKSFQSMNNLSDLCAGKHGSDNVSSIGSLDSVSSLESSSSMTSIRSGMSISNAPPSQLIFDDHNDMDADMYVNHVDYKKGSSLDVENLLHHLTTERGKKDFKNKLILDTMYKREDASNAVIRDVRAATPDVTQMPSQVGVFLFCTMSMSLCLYSVCLSMFVSVCLRVCLRFLCLCVFMSVDVYVCVYMCVCPCMWVCVYVCFSVLSRCLFLSMNACLCLCNST